MKKRVLFMTVLLALANIVAVFAQNKPFPQGVTYPNCIKPNHVTQAVMNSAVGAYYDYWKTQHLKKQLNSLPGGYYVKGNITGSADGFQPLGSSEGQGYGMVITALMAGYDPEAKTNYDALFKTARAFRSSANSNLMGWVVADAAGAQGHFDSATDGDMDIAYSLILAHYQWGSTGTINYLEEAKKMITNGLKASNVTNNNRLNLGDWGGKNTYDTRPSDWMLSHMRAFYAVTGDITWLNVINNLHTLYTGFTTSYSSTTGLVTDFIVGNPAQPCPSNFLDEYPETNTFSYNACRFPLRLVMDYALYGEERSKTASDKIANWIKAKASNSPANIKDGYKLDGTVTGSYGTAVFTSPMIAVAVTNSANQAWVNSGWDWMKAKKEDYYSDSYNMLCLLFISGNWWIPGGTTTPTNQAPTVSITSPANNATFTAPASITINATAADADGTISQVQFFNGATSLGTDNSTPYSFAWTNVAAGTYTLTAKATDNAGAVTTSSAITVVVNPAPVPQSPYNGVVAQIPGTIQAENYDLGGEGVAYHDNTPTNLSGAYRTDAVDIEPNNQGDFNVDYVATDEWMEYTVNVTSAGAYNIDAYVATSAGGKSFRIELDGVSLGNLLPPNTGGWQNWQTVRLANVNLTAGQKILRIYATSTDLNMDKFVFAKVIANNPPTVSITAPSNNAAFNAPASINITANAADADGTISQVQFFNGATSLGTDNSFPYSFSWTNVAAGTYTLTAKATDNSGAVTTSAAVTITVNALTTPNQAPVVSNEKALTNSPNPFTTSTLIEVVNAQAGEVTVAVYNKTGQLVHVISEGHLDAGTHQFVFDASGLNADLYIVKCNSGSGVITRKIMKAE